MPMADAWQGILGSHMADPLSHLRKNSTKQSLNIKKPEIVGLSIALDYDSILLLLM